ncbi:MAG: hypothetical protein KIT83_09575 [Bryobacterales bacterium]|nr:hypothetical protein [Bryobacterales bacterium]
MDKLSRRDLATFASALAVVAGPRSALRAEPQAASQPARDATDLLTQRKASVARASEELRAFDLEYADEPIFRMVIR